MTFEGISLDKCFYFVGNIVALTKPSSLSRGIIVSHMSFSALNFNIYVFYLLAY